MHQRKPGGGYDSRAAYAADLGPLRVRMARELAILAAVLYAVFGVLDWWAIPSALAPVWGIRAGVVVGLLGLWTLTHGPIFQRFYAPFMLGTFLVLGMGIEAMVVLAGPHDAARWLYYAGLILVVMALYAFALLPVRWLAATGACLVVVYWAIAVGVQHMTQSDDWVVLLANSFFLIGANIIGVLASRQRERLLHEGFALRQRLQAELQRTTAAKQRAEWLATRDALTGLVNRAAFMRQLQARVVAARQGKGQPAVLFIDLDGFKQVNDRYGHAVGDEVLRVMARRFQGCVRDHDVVARLGGDEFAILLWLDGDDDGAAVQRVTQSVEAAAAQAISVSGLDVHLGASVGVAHAPADGGDAEQLLSAADAAMYAIKHRRHGPPAGVSAATDRAHAGGRSS
ncbi:MAG: GGDEF domain-containing protein [Pseudomonadota bacterium]